MIRFGVIGAGRIARTFAEALKKTEGCAYAIASRDAAKAEAFKTMHGFEVAYGSYEAMLNDPLVDCVYIATPHAFHKAQMLLAIDHGKAVLCEKAFTVNAAEAEEVFARAKAQGVFVMEAMWSRFLPTVRAVVRRVHEHVIGTPCRLDIDFSFLGDPNDTRLYDPKLGGGALLDIGVYAITFANLIFGAPERIETTAEMHDQGVDIAETITYHYVHATATMRVGFTENRPIEARLYGSEGSIRMPWFWQMETAHRYDKGGVLIETLSHPHRANGFEYQIDEVIRCLEANKLESDWMPHRTTLDILRQMDTLRHRWSMN